MILLYEGWFYLMRTPSSLSSLLNMVVIHWMRNLKCALSVLSMFFKISLLVISGKTLDIWSISNDLVLDQELSLACWYLMFLNIKVFLRNLFFSSSISSSNSLIVSNCLLIFSLCYSFQTSNSLSPITVIVSFSIFCFLFYLFHLDVYLSGCGVRLLNEVIKLFIE